MSVDVFINFDGNCREAVEFYSEVFNTEKPKFMTFGDTPPNPDFPLSEEAKKLILYTFLNIKGSNVMFSDIPPSMTLLKGNNITLVIASKDLDEIKSLFVKLKEDGSVDMELQETFWSKCYGAVTDKFGLKWQLSYSSADTAN